MGRVRGTRGPAAALLAALLVAALGGCGSDEAGGSASDAGETAEATPAGESEESPTEEPSEDAAPVAIERGPFCDRIGDDVVEAAIGGPSRWERSRRPGDEFEVTIGNTEVERDFFCAWQTNAEGTDYQPGDAILVVRVQGKPASAASARTKVTEGQQIDDSLYASCEETEVPFAAEVSYARVCESPGDRYNQPRATGSVTALLGDALLTCFVERAGKQQLPEVTAALQEACYAVPESLAS